MIVRVRRVSLLEGVQIVSNAISKDNIIEAHRSILIRTGKNSIRLHAQKSGIYVETNVEAEVINSGEIAVDANLFLNIVRNITDEFIEIEDIENQELLINTYHSELKMKYSINDCSINVDAKERLEIKKDVFRNMISKITFAISEVPMLDSKDYGLLEILDDKLIMAGTDGVRISVVKYLLEETYVNPIKALIYKSSWVHILKILSIDNSEIIYISINDNNILVKTDNTKVRISSIAGNFNDYEKRLAIEWNTRIEVNRELFIQLLQLVVVIFERQQPKAIFTTSENIMYIKAKSESSLCDINQNIEINLESEDIEIAFNVRYVLDVLKNIDQENIIFSVYQKGGSKWGMIEPLYIDDNEEIYRCLLCSMNIRED